MSCNFKRPNRMKYLVLNNLISTKEKDFCCQDTKVKAYFFNRTNTVDEIFFKKKLLKKRNTEENIYNENAKNIPKAINLIQKIKKNKKIPTDYSNLINYIKIYNKKDSNKKDKLKEFFDIILDGIHKKESFEFILYEILELLLTDIKLQNYDTFSKISTNNKNNLKKNDLVEKMRKDLINSYYKPDEDSIKINENEEIKNFKILVNKSINTSNIKNEIKEIPKKKLLNKQIMVDFKNNNYDKIIQTSLKFDKSISKDDDSINKVEYISKIENYYNSKNKDDSYDNEIEKDEIISIKEESNEGVTSRKSLDDKNFKKTFMNEKDFEKEIENEMIYIDSKNKIKNSNDDLNKEKIDKILYGSNFTFSKDNVLKKTNQKCVDLLKNNGFEVINEEKPIHRNNSDFLKERQKRKNSKINLLNNWKTEREKTKSNSKSFILDKSNNNSKIDFSNCKMKWDKNVYISKNKREVNKIQHFDIDNTTKKKKF